MGDSGSLAGDSFDLKSTVWPGFNPAKAPQEPAPGPPGLSEEHCELDDGFIVPGSVRLLAGQLETAPGIPLFPYDPYGASHSFVLTAPRKLGQTVPRQGRPAQMTGSSQGLEVTAVSRSCVVVLLPGRKADPADSAATSPRPRPPARAIPLTLGFPFFSRACVLRSCGTGYVESIILVLICLPRECKS